MTDPAQQWIDMVKEGQRTALPSPRTADDHIGDSEENTQDNHFADQYEDPHYEDPIDPSVLDGDEAQPENEQPPAPPAKPKRGTK